MAINTLGEETTQRSPLGALLQGWRRVRGKSQLALALDAAVTPRHVSFVETGRAHPSRTMVITLADALEIPLRERNELLLAAGYAPLYRESGLEAADLSPVRSALDRMLRQHEPFPAIVIDRHWNLLQANAGADRLFGAMADLSSVPAPVNVLRLIFDPLGVRPAVANWEELAGALIQRVHREAVGHAPDPATLELLQDLLGQPGVPSQWRARDVLVPSFPVVPAAFRVGDKTLTYFSMVTTLGTPQDVALQEIRIETFFPADTETETEAHRMARGQSRPT